MWRLAAAMAALLLPGTGTARAEWRRAESPNFVAYGEMPEAQLRERVRLLEEFDAFLRLLTGTTAPPSPNKLSVYFVSGTGEMRIIADVGPFVAGFYRSTPGGVFAVAKDWTTWQGAEDDTLFHEYAHHFMMQYHPAPYPTWYVEGFADYVATVSIAPTRIEYGNFSRVRASWLTSDTGWVPYQDILFGNLRTINPAEFYAQSWLLVHYIMADQGRREAFVRYVQALARGEASQLAFEAAFRMPPSQLDRLMRAYRNRLTFHRIERAGPPGLPQISVTVLAGRAQDAPLVQAALLGEVRENQRARLLARARELGREDAYGRRIQARAEIVLGDPAAADRLLDDLLAQAPQDAELLLLKGLRHIVTARREPAARAAHYRLAGPFLARALRVSPDYWQALYLYAETLPDERLLSDNGQNILLLASSLAPQVTEIRLAAAHLLLLRGKFAEAEAVLLPLSAAAHGTSDRSRRAAELLRLARARERPADTIIFKLPEPAA